MVSSQFETSFMSANCISMSSTIDQNTNKPKGNEENFTLDELHQKQIESKDEYLRFSFRIKQMEAELESQRIRQDLQELNDLEQEVLKDICEADKIALQFNSKTY